MKALALISFAIGLVFLISCGDGNVVVATDSSEQRAIDIGIINEYLTAKGYDPTTVDTTESGVRYIIIDEGEIGDESLSIEESDIVEFDYIGRLTTDKLFDTSIEAISEEDTTIFTTGRTFEPIRINYSSTGWTLGGAFIVGFSQGITATFGKVHIGSRVLIIIPSDLGYNAVPQFANDIETIPAFSVITFELFPVRVIKQ